MDKVTLIAYDKIYKNFIDEKYLHDGHDEYYYRNLQVKKPANGWRHLRSDEVEQLVKNSNSATNWDDIWVTDEFDPIMIRNNRFFGMVRIGRVKCEVLQYHDLRVPVGITDSSIISCDIGDNVAIHDVHYMANYIVGDNCILFNIQEICTTDHSKFGNGIVKEGEPEDVRVTLEVMNEAGGRSILPFDGMITADAYLWAKYADDTKLQQRLKGITQNSVDCHRGYYGTIGESSVIKNSWILKDAKIGPYCYIKGASKLKNITINSSEEEPTQIGEGVILVNGITGYGCRIFYSVVATRFVLGDNCNLKYGARLIHSVLGDNSTISCCEVLNNLIFPFHEQHHNSSFLIATTVMGQSNIASGATIGSNHNSRSPDGEIFAKRGFWPGLCSDFKHNSKFASFCLISKGSYQNELDIPYPFALVSPGERTDEAISIIPAFWFMYDMFAITRNKNKFVKRDKRKVKIQNIEYDPMAPDTMQEIMSAIERIITLTAEYLKVDYQSAKDYMHQHPDSQFTLFDSTCQKKYGAEILKPVKAYKMYRKIVKYFATRELIDYCKMLNEKKLSLEVIQEIRKCQLFCEWENVGGQIIPSVKLQELFSLIKTGAIQTWNEVHDFYNQCEAYYNQWKVRYALYLLEQLYSRPIEEFSAILYRDIIDDVIVVANDIYEASLKSREKDYTDYYRLMTYRNQKEMESVLGSLSDNSFLIQLKTDTEVFVEDIKQIFEGLVK